MAGGGRLNAFVAVVPTRLRYSVLPALRKSTKWNSYGLVTDIDTTWRAPHYLGSFFEATILAGVTHQYPRGTGRTMGPNNPGHFDAARTFWAFSLSHPKN